MLRPKHLVFAGGGPRCLSFLGALEVLQSKNVFTNVSHYWGNSAGAIVATFMSMKIPMPKLRTIFETLDFTRFRDIDLTNIVTFGEKWGLDSGEAFTRHMKELLEAAKPGSSHYTLQELPGLHITAADITDTKMVILDGITSPTLKVVDALRASTSIPFFYRPFRNPIDGHLLVDGAVGANFPWILLPTDEDRKSALGFNFNIYDVSREPKSLSEFIPKILNFRESCRKLDTAKKIKESNIINFNVRGFPAWHLALKKTDRDELIAIGEKTINDWLTSHSAEGKIQTLHECAPQHTQSSVTPSSKLLSDNPLHQHQRRRQDSSQDSPTLCSRSARRWSV
jgi:predicted acylesterase/phospholipase RssA